MGSIPTSELRLFQPLSYQNLISISKFLKIMQPKLEGILLKDRIHRDLGVDFTHHSHQMQLSHFEFIL